MKTIVGLYKSMAEANKVKAALAAEGLSADKITVINQSADNSSTDSYGTDSYNTAGGQGRSDDGSVGGKIKNFFSSLSGSDESAHQSYNKGVSQGGALVAVSVADERAEAVADMLYQHGATDIEGGYGEESTGRTALATTPNTANQNTTATTDGQVIPIVEEQLVVGKRTVERGGVRIYSHMVETPVSESIKLHEERVVMERNAVNRPATDADFATGTGVVELRATGEEAVVGKSSRVVEEVRVGKQSSDRTEQVSDTVRHTEVDVEPTEVATTTTGARTTTDKGRL